MENQTFVNPCCSHGQIGEASFEPGGQLLRHGGVIRCRNQTIRMQAGPYRCPPCGQVPAACSLASSPDLPLWHRDVAHYLELVGSHGIPEEDRPPACPHCRQNQHRPHRHSHYERMVCTASQHVRLCIFRLRCPDCRYVHSVIPAFLEPYHTLALDLQEELVEALVGQDHSLEQVAEASETLPNGGVSERTLSRLVQGWTQRLHQLEQGLWIFLLRRVPHLSLSRSPTLWSSLRLAWQATRQASPALRPIGFLHGLNRLAFFLTVTLHG